MLSHPGPRAMLIFAVCVLAAEPADAQGTALRLPRIERAPTLAEIASPGFDSALRIEGFRQRDPNDGDAATQATVAFLAHDDRNLYVAFVCADREPGRVRGRLSKRDTISQDDQVVLMLDTFHDRQRAYLFAVNPVGVQADAIASEGRDDDYTFDAVWRSEGRLLPNGFAVLMTIPFKSIRIPPNGEMWGIALARLLPRNSEQSFWPYVTRRVEGLMQQFATINVPHRVAGGRNVQLIPYAAVSSGRYLDAGTSTFSQPRDRRAGIDAKIVVKDAVSVDLALNPDFSQVESDQPQVAINQRFELFYPEKRPFFLENASVFKYGRTAATDPSTRNVPEMMFFSRRIQNPEFGARVTGKAGPWSFGTVVADDRGLGAAATQGRAAIVVGRVQREFGRQSTVGAFLTSRTVGGAANQVAALDFRWKPSPNWVIAGQAATSSTEGREGSRLDGPAYNASLFYSSRRMLYSLFYSDRSPAFRTALGFVPRTDIRQIEQYGEYRWRPRAGPIVAYGPNTYFRLNWNRHGQLQEWIVRFPFEVHLKGRTQVFVRRVESFELFNGADLRGHIQTINVTTEWLKWLAITEGFEWGVTPNYFPPVGTSPRMANSRSGTLALIFRPTPRLRLEQTYLYSALTASTADGDDGSAIFRNHIARSTFTYQFTRELSARVIVDANAVRPDPSRVRLVHDQRLGIDSLFTYQVGPTTAMHFGYTSGFQNVLAAEPGRPVLRSEHLQTQVGRQLFLKISYLFRL